MLNMGPTMEKPSAIKSWMHQNVMTTYFSTQNIKAPLIKYTQPIHQLENSIIKDNHTILHQAIPIFMVKAQSQTSTPSLQTLVTNTNLCPFIPTPTTTMGVVYPSDSIKLSKHSLTDSMAAGESVEHNLGSQKKDPNSPIAIKNTKTEKNESNENIHTGTCTKSFDDPILTDENNRKNSYRKRNEISLQFLTWNLRSFNSIAKLHFIEEANADIVLLQEIWQSNKHPIILPGEDRVCKYRNANEQGGGTMIAWNIKSRMEIIRKYDVNVDSFVAKFTIASNRYIWLASIYLNRGTKEMFMDTISQIQDFVPEKEWPFLLLCGDWNIDMNFLDKDPVANEKQKVNRANMVKEIAKQMGLSIKTAGNTHNENMIDFILVGKELVIEDVQLIKSQGISDHEAISFKLKIFCPKSNTRKIKIPNKRLAESFTKNSLKKAENSNEFLSNIEKRMETINNNISKEMKIKPKKRELLKRLMKAVDDDEDLKEIIDKYWNEKAIENESMRFSSRSREAFQFLKMFKYHEHDRRDGSIINKIIDENDEIITKEEEVNQKIIEAIKFIQYKEDEPQYIKFEPFPSMSSLIPDEMKEIVEKLSSGKAISFDGISDSLFNSENKAKTARILRDIWSCFHEKEWQQLHFAQRLIPINKAHPNIPKVSECRPIIVSSPLIKLLEMRIKPKLDEYMTKKLTSSQTGFIRCNGITVNQQRLIERIRLRTMLPPGQRKHVYGIFVDYSNAYNTVLHSKLFERLERALNPEDIQLIKVIYSRNIIKLGESSFKPNIGLAQGSVIPPGLFNIYCEDLFKIIEENSSRSVDAKRFSHLAHFLSSLPLFKLNNPF